MGCCCVAISASPCTADLVPCMFADHFTFPGHAKVVCLMLACLSLLAMIFCFEPLQPS